MDECHQVPVGMQPTCVTIFDPVDLSISYWVIKLTGISKAVDIYGKMVGSVKR